MQSAANSIASIVRDTQDFEPTTETMITLLFHSGKLWYSDKPVPTKPPEYNIFELDFGRSSDPLPAYQKLIRDNANAFADWLSTAYEVMNPEGVPCVKKSFGKWLEKNGRIYYHFEDGDIVTLPEGYGIELTGLERLPPILKATITLPD